MFDRNRPASPESPSGLSRRDLIRRGLAVGSVGYVAPMILGSAVPASAQVSGSGCSSATTDCDFFVGCGENADQDPCACAPTIGGSIGCIQTGEAINPDPECCTGNGDCPNGWFCIDFENTVNCFEEANPCDGPLAFCFPPCGTLAPDV
jgi:hypothetical protein